MHILNRRASTFPITTRASFEQQQQNLPRLSTTSTHPRSASAHGFPEITAAVSLSSQGDARSEPRTSCSDEAQACFNLLLILRADTQHLIGLRNDNLDPLEQTVPARPLLGSINDALAAASRSIAELGPFLERHRWPPGNDIYYQQQQQQQRRPLSSFSLRPILRRRRGSKSHSVPPAEAGVSVIDGWLCPEELFSWTLALTAQHTAVLAALRRLERFLAYGEAALEPAAVAADDQVDAEERRRREAAARSSWWEQRRGEFENVGLIQSLMARPRRKPSDLMGAVATGTGITITSNAAATATATATTTTTTTTTIATTTTDSMTTELDSQQRRQQRVGYEAAGRDIVNPSNTAHDDARSETVMSEPLSEPSIMSTPHNGLTVRPRVQSEGLWMNEAIYSRRVVTEPGGYSPPPLPSPSSEETTLLSRSETFGQATARPTLPLSRFNSVKQQRPRIATHPLPPLIGLQTFLPETRVKTTGVGIGSGGGGGVGGGGYLSPGFPSSSSSSADVLTGTTPILTPLLTPGSNHGNNLPGFSPVAETPYTPYTPLDQELAALIVQKALPSKTIQPVIQQLEDMIVSPVESQEVVPLGVSPTGTSPQGSTRLSVVRRHHDDDGGDDGGDNSNKHTPYLVYMARKQALVTSRWSLRRTRTSEI